MRRMLFCAFALLGCTAESAAIAGRADDGEDELDLTPKLSAINILIAPNVSYTIKASPPGLCVQWETNNKDKLHLDDANIYDDLGCAKDGSIQVTAREALDGPNGLKTDLHVMAMGRDADGRAIKPLRCDVVIEHIHAIAIQRTQSRLKQGCQQVVQVRAKDSSNNTFSGLQGVPFVWTIQDGDEDPNDGPACSPTDPAACSVVVPLLLSSQNSSQKASPRRKEMENEWKAETDQIVLEAKTPGDATVSVKLKGDTNIAAKKWIVDVMEPLTMDPWMPLESCKGGCALYVIRNSCWAYELKKEQKCGNETVQIYDGSYLHPRTPVDQYSWSSSNESRVVVHPGLGAATALDLGQVEIRVHDSATDDEIDERAEVNVVEAADVAITIIELNRGKTADGSHRSHGGSHGSAAFNKPEARCEHRDCQIQCGNANTKFENTWCRTAQKCRYLSDCDTAMQAADDRGIYHLIRQRPYHFVTRLYDADAHEIYIAPNMAVAPSFARSTDVTLHETSDHRSVNGTATMAPFSCSVTASFDSVVGCQTAVPAIPAIAGIPVKAFIGQAERVSHKPLATELELVFDEELKIQRPGACAANQPDDCPLRLLLGSRHAVLASGASYRLNASGGNSDRDFVWRSADSDVATVSEEGVVTAVAIGEVLIYCTDRWNIFNYDSLSVVAAPPARLAFTKAKMETGTGDILTLGISVLSSDGLAFHSCNSINLNDEDAEFSVGMTDGTIFAKTDTGFVNAEDWACIKIDLIATVEGSSEINVIWKPPAADNPVSYEISRKYAAFRALTVSSPLRDANGRPRAVAAIGCSTSISFEGGPSSTNQLFEGGAPERIVSVSIVADELQRDGVKISKVQAQSYDQWEAMCLKETEEQKIRIQVSNGLTEDQLKDYAETIEVQDVQLVCAVPRSIEIIPENQPNISQNAEVWQATEDLAKLRMCADTAHGMKALLYTRAGREGDVFTNASSVQLEWKEWGEENDNVEWKPFPDRDTYLLTFDADATEAGVAVRTSEQFWKDWVAEMVPNMADFQGAKEEDHAVNARRAADSLSLSQAVIAAHAESTDGEAEEGSSAAEKLEHDLFVQVVPHLRIAESTITMLAQAHNSYELSIQYGSSLFACGPANGDQQGLNCHYPPPARNPQPPWGVKTATLTLTGGSEAVFTFNVEDKGVVGPDSCRIAPVTVKSSPLERLEIIADSEAEIGQSLRFSVRGVHANLEPVQQVQLARLRLSYTASNDTVLSSTGTVGSISNNGEFELQSSCLGRSDVTVQTNMLDSNEAEIQSVAGVRVHSTFRCTDTMDLIPGATREVHCTGGPVSEKRFAVNDSKLLATGTDFTKFGIITATDPGHAKVGVAVSAEASSFDSAQNNVEVVHVNVVLATGVLIVSRKTLGVGSDAPLHFDITDRHGHVYPPLALAGATVDCNWTSGAPNIVTVVSNGLTASAVGKGAGSTFVEIECKFVHDQKEFTLFNSKEISAQDPLQILNRNPILLDPGGSAHILLNRDVTDSNGKSMEIEAQPANRAAAMYLSAFKASHGGQSMARTVVVSAGSDIPSGVLFSLSITDYLCTPPETVIAIVAIQSVAAAIWSPSTDMCAVDHDEVLTSGPTAIPLGGQISLGVIFVDAFARHFSPPAASRMRGQVRIKSTNPQLVNVTLADQVELDTPMYTIIGTQVGRAILYLEFGAEAAPEKECVDSVVVDSSGAQKVESAYNEVQVNEVISRGSNHSVLHIGGHSGFVVVNGYNGKLGGADLSWTSETSHIVTIDPTSGKATAKAQGGGTKIFYGQSNTLSSSKTYASVTVSRVTSMRVGRRKSAENILYMNSRDLDEQPRVPVHFFAEDAGGKLQQLLDHNCANANQQLANRKAYTCHEIIFNCSSTAGSSLVEMEIDWSVYPYRFCKLVNDKESSKLLELNNISISASVDYLDGLVSESSEHSQSSSSALFQIFSDFSIEPTELSLWPNRTESIRILHPRQGMEYTIDRGGEWGLEVSKLSDSSFEVSIRDPDEQSCQAACNEACSACPGWTGEVSFVAAGGGGSAAKKLQVKVVYARYSESPAFYTVGLPIQLNEPGPADLLPGDDAMEKAYFSVDPPLPAGIHLDELTGVISSPGPEKTTAGVVAFTVLEETTGLEIRLDMQVAEETLPPSLLYFTLVAIVAILLTAYYVKGGSQDAPAARPDQDAAFLQHRHVPNSPFR